MAFFCGVSLPTSSFVRLAAIAAACLGLLALAALWRSWRQLASPPKIAIGLIGVGGVTGGVAALGHLAAEELFAGIGVPYGGIDLPADVVLAASVSVLWRLAACAALAAVLWFTVYRNRFAPPMNWLIGGFVVTATVGAFLTLASHDYSRAAVDIGEGNRDSTGTYEVTWVCVASVGPTRPTYDPLGLARGPRVLWKIGDHGTQVILLDPARARAMRKGLEDTTWTPAPLTYVPAASIAYWVVPDGTSSCGTTAAPGLAG